MLTAEHGAGRPRSTSWRSWRSTAAGVVTRQWSSTARRSVACTACSRTAGRRHRAGSRSISCQLRARRRGRCRRRRRRGCRRSAERSLGRRRGPRPHWRPSAARTRPAARRARTSGPARPCAAATGPCRPSGPGARPVRPGADGTPRATADPGPSPDAAPSRPDPRGRRTASSPRCRRSSAGPHSSMPSSSAACSAPDRQPARLTTIALVRGRDRPDVVELRHHVLLDRLLPGLALDGHGKVVTASALRANTSTSWRPPGAAFEHLVAPDLVAVGPEERGHLLLQSSSGVGGLTHAAERNRRAVTGFGDPASTCPARRGTLTGPSHLAPSGPHVRPSSCRASPSESEPRMNTKRICSLFAAGALTVGLGLAAMPGIAGAADTPTPATPRPRSTGQGPLHDGHRHPARRPHRARRHPGGGQEHHRRPQGHPDSQQHRRRRRPQRPQGEDRRRHRRRPPWPATAGRSSRATGCFALRAPQTHLVIAGDTETFAVDQARRRRAAGSPTPSTRPRAAGKDMTAAKAALADLQAKVADAANHADGLADSVIGYVPADYNADHGMLDAARANRQGRRRRPEGRPSRRQDHRSATVKGSDRRRARDGAAARR